MKNITLAQALSIASFVSVRLTYPTDFSKFAKLADVNKTKDRANWGVAPVLCATVFVVTEDYTDLPTLSFPIDGMLLHMTDTISFTSAEGECEYVRPSAKLGQWQKDIASRWALRAKIEAELCA